MSARRLLFVHAHPDDESSKGAATAARYVDQGARVVLVTCTGGEAGDVLNPNYPPVQPEQMPLVRRAELDAAVRAVGFSACHLLGERDSGYHEDAAEVPEGCFARVPLDAPAGRLAEIVRAERPHVVVTYPEDGGYPHPDHVRTHAVTMRALDLAEAPGPGGAPWRVPKVYAMVAFPAERVLPLHEALLRQGVDSPFERWFARREELDAAWPRVDARIRVDRWFERRDEALRAHATQIDPEGFWFQVPRELERDLYPYESYTLLRSDVPVTPPEDDLFAGLEEPSLPGRQGSGSAR